MTFFRKLYFNSRHFQPGTFSAYLLAAVLVATATALRVALGSAVPGAQFILLFPAVIATTLICGMAAGFFSVAMGAVCAWFFILPPIFSFRLESVQQIYVLLFFVVIASAIVVIIGAMRTAIERARRLNRTVAAVFEANPDAILLTDPHGRITNVNQRAAVLFGKPREALIGASVDSLLPERFRDRHASLRTSYMADPRPRGMGAKLNLFALRGDGTEFPVAIQIGPIEIDDETLIIATVRDVTEHNTLYKELAESHQRQAVLEARQAGARALHIALESTTDSVVVLDRAWRFTYLNQRAKAQNARGRDLVGRVVWDVFPWLEESVVGIAWRAAMASGVPTHADDYFAQARAHFDTHAYPSTDGLTVFFRDVTEVLSLAAAQAESDALLRLFIDRAPAAIAMFDTEMRYLAVSRRFALDYQIGDGLPETLVGRRHYELFPEIPERWRGIHRRVLAGETLSAEEDPSPRKDGRTDWVRWEMAPWRHADGKIGGAVLFSEIVTDRKEAELALRRLTEDLAARLRENEDLVARLREEVGAREAAQARAAHAERVQALGQLAGGIAHDFNNVLQVVKGAATLIDRRPGDAPAVARLVRLAMEATERGASITRRLLAIGRRADLRAETQDVAALLSSLQEIFVHTLGVNIEVHIELGADLPPLLADKAQLETILVNLATNARDAMPGGGRLTLSAATEIVSPESMTHPAGLAPGRYVRLTVADTGQGMDANTLARALEPFFTTKEIGVGTGLGLPMARGFAEQSGGALSVESSPGHSTTVTLWVPEDASDSSPSAVASRDAADVVASGTSMATTAARVLVVDDEDLLREMLEENLEDRGYDVLVAASGPEALDLLGTGDAAVDVLVTDLSMPGMDGIALIRAAQKRRPGLPAVLLTGYTGDRSALTMGGTINGAYSLALKPITTNDLVDRIEALLAAQSSPLAYRSRF